MAAAKRDEQIRIATIGDLRREESRVVARINATPNGGKLFAVDPLRLLAQIGVVLEPDARAQFERELGLENGSPTAAAYDSIQRGESNPSIRVNVRGILKR